MIEDEPSYLFVDGACFSEYVRKISEEFSCSQLPEINWIAFRDSNRKAFYYDAVPLKKPTENDSEFESRRSAKEDELAKIERQAYFHVRTGVAKFNKKRRGNEQKMVDVNLAVDALLMASRGLFRRCSIVTGDLDFYPLICALVDMGVDVKLLYPPSETAEELKDAADYALPIDVQMLRRWIDPRSGLLKLFPECCIVSDTEPLPAGRDILDFQDAKYGSCLLSFETSAATYSLLTQFVGDPPARSNRLLIKGEDLGGLKTYAKLQFGLFVPETPSS